MRAVLFAMVILAALSAGAEVQACAGSRYEGPALRAPDLRSIEAVGPVGYRALDPATIARLEAAFISARSATGAPSMTAAVMIPGRGAWRGGYGANDRLHYWASAGKTFTAVAVLQLVEEGKLSLTDPVARWIARVPNGDAITIEMLLNHTSGLFSANEDEAFRRRPRRLTAEQALDIARRHGPLFCPGTNWRYSNTGYIMLGAILERVESKSYAEIIQERIIVRLDGAHVRVVSPDDQPSQISPPQGKDAPQASIDPRTPGAAGAIVADAAGMIAFEHALLSGRLLRPEAVHSMLARLYPMFGQEIGYGLGLMVYELPARTSDGADVIWIGHSGGAPGVKAVFAYSPADAAFVAVALTGDGSAEASASLLLRALREPD